MIKIILLVIIISIIIEQLIPKGLVLDNDIPPHHKQSGLSFQLNNSNSLYMNKKLGGFHQPQNSVNINKTYKKHKSKHHKNNQPRIIHFDNPQPWNKIIFEENNKYPYTFFIKLDIPSFNDYHNWKQIIPTLNFIPQSKELTISTINEDIAIAIINLVILTFSNKITFDEMLSKNLINISISKVQEHPDVKLSFKNQIIQYLYTPQENQQENQQEKQQENQQENNTNFISAYDGADYSYL
jgi:hypothetical protein